MAAKLFTPVDLGVVHPGVIDPGVNFIGKPFAIMALAAKIKSMGF